MKRRTQKKQRRRRQKGGFSLNPLDWFSSVQGVAKSAADSVQGAVQSTTAALTPGQPNPATTDGAVKLAGTPPETPGTNLVGGRRRRTVRRRS